MGNFKKTIPLALLVAALGYFVDVYDIILFIAVRVPSLKALSISGDELTRIGLFKNRRKVAFLFLSVTACSICGYLSLHGMPTSIFYSACVILGFGAGYWAVFIMISSEQFGTNFRATVTTSLPNMVRALVVPSSFILQWLRPSLGLLTGLKYLGFGFLALAFVSLFMLKETYGTDLDFLEV